jgi:hypothetical protein
MFTLFSVPKPFQGHIGTLQENAIHSWTKLGANHEVILLGDEDGVASVAERLGIRHEPEIRFDAHGSPLMNSVFDLAQRTATNEWLCYVNCDIVLTSDFARAMRRISKLRRPVLVSGRRWRLEVDEPIDFEEDWERRWRQHVKANGERDSVINTDYFIFQRGLVRRFPEFALGRGRWNTFLPYQLREQGALFVDASGVIMAVHQNHDYAYPPGVVGNRNKALMRDMPGWIANANLAAREERLTLGNADRKLTRWRFKRTYDHVRLRWWLWMKLAETNGDTRFLGIRVHELRKRHKVRLKRLLTG